MSIWEGKLLSWTWGAELFCCVEAENETDDFVSARFCLGKFLLGRKKNAGADRFLRTLRAENRLPECAWRDAEQDLALPFARAWETAVIRVLLIYLDVSILLRFATEFKSLSS